MEDGPKQSAVVVEEALRLMVPKLPGLIRHRAQNSLNGIDKAFTLLPVDREIASFRAITAEEEGVTAIIMALRHRDYENWKRLNAYNHSHKAAVRLGVEMVARSFTKGLKTFTFEFDLEKPRIDVKIALSDFGVNVPGHDDLAIQPVEPLGLVITKEGADGKPGELDMFDRELDQIVKERGKSSSKELIKFMANQRNTLLYASDSALPSSLATAESLEQRKSAILAMLCTAVMIFQAKEHQPTAKQAVQGILAMLGQAPADKAAGGA